MTDIADAIRNVTAKVQKAIDDGHRSRMIDADDVVEILLAIAEELDPPHRTPDVATRRPSTPVADALPIDNTRPRFRGLVAR